MDTSTEVARSTNVTNDAGSAASQAAQQHREPTSHQLLKKMLQHRQAAAGELPDSGQSMRREPSSTSQPVEAKSSYCAGTTSSEANGSNSSSHMTSTTEDKPKDGARMETEPLSAEQEKALPELEKSIRDEGRDDDSMAFDDPSGGNHPAESPEGKEEEEEAPLRDSAGSTAKIEEIKEQQDHAFKTQQEPPIDEKATNAVRRDTESKQTTQKKSTLSRRLGKRRARIAQPAKEESTEESGQSKAASKDERWEVVDIIELVVHDEASAQESKSDGSFLEEILEERVRGSIDDHHIRLEAKEGTTAGNVTQSTLPAEVRTNLIVEEYYPVNEQRYNQPHHLGLSAPLTLNTLYIQCCASGEVSSTICHNRRR